MMKKIARGVLSGALVTTKLAASFGALSVLSIGIGANQ